MNQKRIMIILGLLIAIIFILFFTFHYKTQKNGNNINKSADKIVKDILDINSYEAEIEVTVDSNKTTNKYELRQYYYKPDFYKQVIQENDNLENLTIIKDKTEIRVENTKLSIPKIYENFECINDNNLWLSTFIKNYDNKNSKITEKEDEIIVENNKVYNIYNEKQILYINKRTGLPEKIEIIDNNKNNKIYIKYNKINLNNIKEKDIEELKK